MGDTAGIARCFAPVIVLLDWHCVAVKSLGWYWCGVYVYFCVLSRKQREGLGCIYCKHVQGDGLLLLVGI